MACARHYYLCKPTGKVQYCFALKKNHNGFIMNLYQSLICFKLKNVFQRYPCQFRSIKLFLNRCLIFYSIDSLLKYPTTYGHLGSFQFLTTTMQWSTNWFPYFHSCSLPSVSSTAASYFIKSRKQINALNPHRTSTSFRIKIKSPYNGLVGLHPAPDYLWAHLLILSPVH